MVIVRWANKQSPAGPAAGWDDLRAHNTALLFREIWEGDGPSRADLARRTGLSRATVSDIVNGFLLAGAVTESEVAPSNGGRPPIRLRFEDGWRHLVGVELGASHISGVRTDLRGHVLAAFHEAAPVATDPEATLAALDAGIAGLLAAVPSVPVLGIGIGVPSPVRFVDQGRLAPHLFPGWSAVDLLGHLSATHELPVRLDNDANLGALAEHWWGAGRGLGEFAYVKVATGVGAGILIDGRIYRGASGIAGEIGHTTIDPNGPRCRCGLDGCLEAMVGSSSLLQAAEERLGAGPRPGWALPRLTVHGLIEGARAGDPVARGLVSGAGVALGIAFANLLNLVNPGRVVLGGPLTEAGSLLLDPLLDTMARRALWSSMEGSALVLSPLGDRAVALGAATLLLQHLLESPGMVLGELPTVPLSAASAELPA